MDDLSSRGTMRERLRAPQPVDPLGGQLRVMKVHGPLPGVHSQHRIGASGPWHYVLRVAPSVAVAAAKPSAFALDEIPEPKLGDKVPTPPKPPRGTPPWRPTWATNADGRMPVWAIPPTHGLTIHDVRRSGVARRSVCDVGVRQRRARALAPSGARHLCSTPRSGSAA